MKNKTKDIKDISDEELKKLIRIAARNMSTTKPLQHLLEESLRRMKIFKKGVEITTDDFWYDLFEGGYIKPEKLLVDEEYANKVRKSIEVLREFKKLAYDEDIVTDL